MEQSSGEYKYDVFFSYRRKRSTLVWTRRVYGLLNHWLQEEIPDRDVRIFVDEDDIDPGERWPEKLRDALRHSRCMVCVWTPSYFRSDWCVSEWQSFREREKRLSMVSHGLIAPMRYHDGEHFPKDARDVQWTDVQPYALIQPAFWNTQGAVDLEIVLKGFAHSVAKIIGTAPPFAADWPVSEWKAPPPKKIGLARL